MQSPDISSLISPWIVLWSARVCVFDFFPMTWEALTHGQTSSPNPALTTVTLFQMHCALSFTYSFNQCLLKTHYAPDGSPENRMVSKTDEPLDFLLPAVWSFPDSLHAVPSIHKGQVTGSSPHSSSSATFPSTLGWHSRHWAASWAIIMDTNCQPPVSQSSKLYFYPAIALVRGHHPARGTTQMLKCSKSVLHVFLPYPPPTLPTALTPTNTCKYACELPKGKNLF